MLIFHQEDFRRDWQAMYDSREHLIDSYPNPAFMSTFLVVIAIALQYTGSHRQHLLREYGVDSSTLKEKFLSIIRAKLLDIVSLASLEAVQTCVLLGTYYLYHGNPGLAWPVCGCGLRLAQALNLHRRVPSSGSLDPETQRKYETRKRCWWAIYEIETFCSMSYGYPLSIKDADCDVELLDPLVRTVHSPASFSSTHQFPTTLLSYKYLMSKLSVLIKDTLTDLYGIGSYRATGVSSDRSENFNLRNLIRKVSALDARLKDWKAEIPDLLCMDKLNSQRTYSSVDEMDQDIGAKGPGFENHICQLQALTLELAYQNTRILVHRPLLTYKMIPNDPGDTEQAQDPFQRSLQTCREAALSTSSIGSTPIFPLAADTYAVTFIGIHTFTAGVMLCILASIESLTVHSHASKMGLRQVLQMQMQLESTSRSVLAAQGLEVLQRLIKLVLDKEMKEMFTPEVSVNSDIGTLPGISNLPVQDSADCIESMAGFDALLESDVFNYVHDPAMSQALCNFDQGNSSS
ncbi:fungal-specific transcription factor domain-containing protein [Penicillium malachiteum]|uniref:fungal-specific transcription factor domain-containing protein n=1 Tax=Penicillium malachiteum TaxID=1324776 RepID=UPI00254754B4|nr:fungal-specific transcription factor domain-containing protein [Penicillium malachiteum]KAJ5715677.1 fungal-specific transcription factor domain-containing protein [Penicillium malachiteum]